MSTLFAVVGRIMIAVLFVAMGAGILYQPDQFDALIRSVGMPGGLAIPIGVFEVLGGLFLAIGLMTRLVAVLLFALVALIALFFHRNAADPGQLAMLLADFAIMGGLLMVVAHSQMWWSFDMMRAERRGERAALGAEERAHAAELRAAHAEGAAEVLAPPPRPRWRWWS